MKKKSLLGLCLIVACCFISVLVVKADFYNAYGIANGRSHTSDITNLGKSYPKYWFKGTSGNGNFRLSLYKYENNSRVKKSTRNLRHTVGRDEHVKFDNQGGGYYDVRLDAINGDIFGYYKLYSGDSYEATFSGDVK